MKLPTGQPSVNTISAVAAWARTFGASVAAGWNVEHKPDGTHAAVTADSLDVSGSVEVGDDLTVASDLTVAGAADITGQLTQRALIDLIGGQIGFPATAVPSSGANVLDDYEEATFSPALKFGSASVGMTFSTQSGAYVKVGRLFILSVFLQLTAKGSSTGNAEIQGMPLSFNMNSVVPFVGSLAGGPASPPLAICTGTSVLLYSGAIGALTDANFTDTTFLYFSAVGQTAA